MGLIESAAFDLSLDYPWLFRRVVRPVLYRRYAEDPETGEQDPERVHETALRLLDEHESSLWAYGNRLASDFPHLVVAIKGRRYLPFGTAAGMDKNGDALRLLSRVFGFLEPGTVVMQEREGNPRPRVAVHESYGDIYNAQGFPSKGLDHFLENIREFRLEKRLSPVYISVCGIPSQDKGVDNALSVAWEEMETLLTELGPYADGFVWNPFSPNTETLRQLQTPEVFQHYAELVKKHAPDPKLRLVKMGPYSSMIKERDEWLRLVGAWLDGGGDGIVAVNTKMVPRSVVPAEEWGYKSAGKSGRSLRLYRKRAVRDARTEFPDAVIFATGGIENGDDAYQTFAAGADALEGFTPYTYHGFGMLRKLMNGVSRNLEKRGYSRLEELQALRK